MHKAFFILAAPEGEKVIQLPTSEKTGVGDTFGFE